MSKIEKPSWKTPLVISGVLLITGLASIGWFTSALTQYAETQEIEQKAKELRLQNEALVEQQKANEAKAVEAENARLQEAANQQAKAAEAARIQAELDASYAEEPDVATCPITTCNDGSCSESTGRGTCSWHGGVRSYN